MPDAGDVARSAGVRALIALEDGEHSVFDAKVPRTDALLWPLARSAVAGALAAEDIGTGRVAFPRRSLKTRALRAARRLVPNPHSAARAPRAEHLFIVSGWTRIATPAGYRNWLSDDFAEAAGASAIVVQDAFLDSLSQIPQRPVLADRTFSYARDIESVTRETARHPLSSSDRASVREAVDEYFRLLTFEISPTAQERTADDIIGRASRAAFDRARFSRLLDRVRPRRIFMQTAAYGVRSPDIREAHQRGISVTELQHGWIGRSHLAYNFGAAMHTGPLLSHLPDKMLTFGDFWGAGLLFPGELIPIGKPSLDRQQQTAPAYDARPRRLLFVSTRYAHDVLEDVVLELRRVLPADWTIAVRPHPSERAGFEARVPRLLAHDRIELDPVADAEESMMRSRAVVGFSSTMLYESLAYGCHVAVVRSTAAEHYTDASVIPLRIEPGDDLSAIAEIFGDPPTRTERALAERVWRPDAVAHFLAEAQR